MFGEGKGNLKAKMGLRECFTGRGYDLVARQLLRPGYKTKEYSPSILRRIHFLSILVYIFTAFTFAITTVLYNPDNLFGDNGLVSTPILSFQTRELQDNCETLVLLFDDVNTQSATDTSRSAPLLKLVLPNAREATFDSSIHVLKSTVATNAIVDIHSNVTLSWSGEVEICKNFLRPLLIDVSALLISCDMYCGFGPLASTADNLTLLNSNPIVEGSQTSRGNSALFPFEFEFGFYDLHIPNINGGLQEYYGVGLDAPVDVEANLDSFCTATTFAAVNLANLPPFACTVTQFRGWLEVVALAGSNAGLIYALAIIVFGALITQPSSEETEAAVKA